MRSITTTAYQTLRPWIFRSDPERAHSVTLRLLRLSGQVPGGQWLLRNWFRPLHPVAPVPAFGLTFANSVGLAAGYDKDGMGWRGLTALGFGHIEIGTVTLRPQPGNPGPRIFRLPGDEAVINRMGFPSRGAAFVAKQLQGRRPAGLILGVNIGKNKDTPLEAAAEDYVALMRIFAPLSDYLAINVSSPNTPGLRSLQNRSTLETLLLHLARERSLQVQALGRPVPLLVKLALDLAPRELEDALDAITRTGIDGVIISNTTVRRYGLASPLASETGGLSGAPVRRNSTQLVRLIDRWTNHTLPIVASGGVMRPEDACEKLSAGAVLVQLYTGLIYAGPDLPRQAIAATCSAGRAQPRLPVGRQLAPQGLAAALPAER